MVEAVGTLYAVHGESGSEIKMSPTTVVTNSSGFTEEEISTFRVFGSYRNLWRQRLVKVYQHPTDQAQVITVGDSLQKPAERIICCEPYATVAGRVENNDWSDYQ